MTRSEAIDKWVAARVDDYCTCHRNAPCAFCVDGYSLSLTEYLDLLEEDLTEDDQKGQNSTESDYDRAMRGI